MESTKKIKSTLLTKVLDLDNQKDLIMSMDKIPNLKTTKKLLYNDKSDEKINKALSYTNYSKFWDPTFLKITRNSDRVDKIIKGVEHRKSMNYSFIYVRSKLFQFYVKITTPRR